MPRRQQMWDRLGSQVDLLVIGGGVTGAGVARDAARRGLSVALVEMRDLAFGTSSRSSKLVHGGLRYLEQYAFSLVFEAVSERRILMDIAPHLVHPMGFLFPVYEGDGRKLWFINAGMWLYDGLSLFRSPKLHRKLTAAQVAEQEPCLLQEHLTGAPVYYDCATDDARLTLETALDAVQAGATVTTYAKAVSFVRDEAGRVAGAVVEDGVDGQLREIRASAVVNATGPWTDRTLAMSGPSAERLLRPTKGIHVVVDAEKLPLEHAVVCSHPQDGRVLFAIPWGDRTYIGTTDTDYDGDPAQVHATADDVHYLLDASQKYFPDQPLTPDDVLATWAGLRPLICPESEPGTHESNVSREHSILVAEDGLITIAGGKLTTYRRMASEVVETVLKLLRLSERLPQPLVAAHTDREPLPGAVGWPSDDDRGRVVADAREVAKQKISQQTAELLVHSYGMRALDVARLAVAEPRLAKPLVEGRPEILAQVDWAVNRELAASVCDILIRRTQLFYRDTDQGLAAAEPVAQRMAELLDWDATRKDQQVQAYRDEVALSRKWRG